MTWEVSKLRRVGAGSSRALDGAHDSTTDRFVGLGGLIWLNYRGCRGDASSQGQVWIASQNMWPSSDMTTRELEWGSASAD